MPARQAPRLVQSQKLRLNTSLAASIRVLRYDASGLTRYLEEQAGENPLLSLDAAPVGEWLPRWTGAFAATGFSGTDSIDLGALVQSPAPGLIAHIMAQIDTIFPQSRARQIAYVLMQALEPSGWLGRPLEALAAEAGASLPEAEAVLSRLQNLEPTGVFARSLTECLRLQAIEEECLDPVMECVLEHLDLLAQGELARLARLCDVTEAEVSRRLRTIRGFDPKPGAQFGQGAAPVREPDLIVKRSKEGWQVQMNRSSLPELTIAEPKKADPATREALANARALQHVVASRNETLLRIGREVLQRQEAALAQGLEALVPMSMAEVGAALGLHESTISRAVAGVCADTPRGTFWLRGMFTAAVGGEGGPAAGALRARLLRLVTNEDPQKPLGDQALAEALSTPQAPLARRTVAKYRDMLNIPPAHRRKQRPD